MQSGETQMRRFLRFSSLFLHRGLSSANAVTLTVERTVRSRPPN